MGRRIFVKWVPNRVGLEFTVDVTLRGSGPEVHTRPHAGTNLVLCLSGLDEKREWQQMKMAEIFRVIVLFDAAAA